MTRKPAPAKSAAGVTRREFARRAALAAASAAVFPTEILSRPGPDAVPAAPRPQEPSSQETRLSPESRAEVEAKIQTVFRRYGSHLSEEQKTDIRRLVAEGQKPLDMLRAFPLENSDGPAAIFQPFRETAAPADQARHGARGSSRRRKRV